MTRRAATLLELLLALSILGVVLALGLAQVGRGLQHAALRETQAVVLVALDAARGSAVRLGEPVALSHQASLLRVVGGTDTLWRRLVGAPTATLDGLGSAIRFGPAGIGLGFANRTLRIHGGADTVTVVLSRLGRIR